MGLITALATSERRPLGRAALWLFAGCMAGMIALDQHRLQPWAYQFALIALVLATCDERRSFALLRWLAVSIYFWSALGKFDHVFLHGVGPQFLAVMAGWLGLSTEAWPEATRVMAAGVFPAGELLVAIGLAFRGTRPVAVAGAMLMHVGLLALLGPWGLNHQPGVLLWNVYFLVQAVLLFGPAPSQTRQTETHNDNEQSSSPLEARRWGLAETLIALALLLPALETWRWWDAWPSWSLYSTRAERVVVLVHRLAAFRLDEELQSFLRPAEPESDWQELEIDRWSLQSLGVPLYPQARFQLGVAEAVGRRYELGGFIQAVELGMADRWTGQRPRKVHLGVDAITDAADEAWLNGRPRGQGAGVEKLSVAPARAPPNAPLNAAIFGGARAATTTIRQNIHSLSALVISNVHLRSGFVGELAAVVQGRDDRGANAFGCIGWRVAVQ